MTDEVELTPTRRRKAAPAKRKRVAPILLAGGELPDELDYELARYSRNDLGNSERLRARHGDDLLHVTGSGWHCWDGRRWNGVDGVNQATRRAHLTSRAILREAAALYADADGQDDEEIADGLRRFAVASGNSGKIRAMLEQAVPYLSRQAADMDANTFVVTCINGTLDLRRSDVVLREHRRGDCMTHLAPVEYIPGALCPTWERFMLTVVPDDEVRGFLQRWWGYCLTGEVSEQVMLLLYGLGANGKSTMVETIADVLGEHATSVPIATFLVDERRGGGDATPDLARLPGRRMVMAAEPEVGARLSESTVKIVTGGEKIVARPLYEAQFEFLPRFKLVLSCNVKPTIRGQDEGIWRRVLMVPMSTTIPLAQRDPALRAKLAREGPGILNWLVEGYLQWREVGLCVPAEVSAATDDYRTESNPITEFLRVCTAPAPGWKTSARDLYDRYVKWCKEVAVDHISANLFGRRLRDRGLNKAKNGTMYYEDIRLIDEEAPEPVDEA